MFFDIRSLSKSLDVKTTFSSARIIHLSHLSAGLKTLNPLPTLRQRCEKSSCGAMCRNYWLILLLSTWAFHP